MWGRLCQNMNSRESEQIAWNILGFYWHRHCQNKIEQMKKDATKTDAKKKDVTKKDTTKKGVMKNDATKKYATQRRYNAEHMQLTKVYSGAYLRTCRTPCLLFQKPKATCTGHFSDFKQPKAKVSQSSSKSVQPHQCNSLQLKQCTQLTQETNKHNKLTTNTAEIPRMIMYIGSNALAVRNG